MTFAGTEKTHIYVGDELPVRQNESCTAGSFIAAFEPGINHMLMYRAACRGSRGLPTVSPDLWKSKILHKKALLAKLTMVDYLSLINSFSLGSKALI